MASGEVLDHRSYLGRLEPADRAFLLRLGHPKRFRKGARIIVQGDHSDNVFLTLSGLIKVTLDTPDGREIVLSVLGAGDLLGEFEVIEGMPQRTAGNVAVLPVECRVIPGDEFMAALETHPQMLLAMVRVILSRLRAADRRREASASMGVSRSLTSFVVELVDRYGTPDGSVIDISIQLTQEELASLISTSRDSAVRGLSTLRTRGLIATRRRQIVVTDPDGYDATHQESRRRVTIEAAWPTPSPTIRRPRHSPPSTSISPLSTSPPANRLQMIGPVTARG